MSGRSLLQGIFPAQGWNPGLPHCRRILYQLSDRESRCVAGWPPYSPCSDLRAVATVISDVTTM